MREWVRQTCGDCPCNGGRGLSRMPQANVVDGGRWAVDGLVLRAALGAQLSGVGIDVVAQARRLIFCGYGLLLLRGGACALGLRRQGLLLLLLLRPLYRRNLGLHHLDPGLQQLGLLLLRLRVQVRAGYALELIGQLTQLLLQLGDVATATG